MNNDVFDAPMNDAMSFTLVDDNGNTIRCDVLFTFECTENGKNYVVYTDNTVDEDGNTRVFAAVYDPDAEEQRLLPVETDEEWALIQHALDTVQGEVYGDDN